MKALLVCLLLLGACGEWRAVRPGELAPGREFDRALVVAGDRAYEMSIYHVDQAWLVGVARRTWEVPPSTRVDVVEPKEQPDKIAERLGWRDISTARGRVDIPAGAVTYVKIYDPHYGKTALVVGGSIVGGLGVIFFGFVLVFAATVACGRPLRAHGKQCITPIARGSSEWTAPVALAPVADAAVRAVLVEVWTEEAQAEHAAIAAFAKLALELIALGAPPALVARANRAAIQEVHHARLCFAVASAYRGEPIGPAPFPEALAGDTVDLARLVRESVVDGCMREGLAGEIARLGAERAKDPDLARVLRVQANEEAQHAELAWDIVAWGVAVGGEPLRRTALAALRDAKLPRCDDLPDHGRIGRATVAPLFRALREASAERIARLGEAASSSRAA